MSIRAILIGAGVIFWIAAAGCWFRARGSGRLSREGVMFLLLGIPFLIAGLFHTSSSYPPETPAPAPAPVIVVITTPAPTPLPASPAPRNYAQAVAAAQTAAVVRYPDLGVAGTDFNTRFVAAYRRLRLADPEFFGDAQWPLALADRIAREIPHGR